MRLLLALVCAVALPAAGCGGGDEEPAASTSASGCVAVERPDPREPRPAEAPTAPLDGDVRAVVVTNCGRFTIALDPDSAPNATASFAALAEAGWFDGTTFHRIVPGFVVQGGDPSATGGGGPGYTTVDPPDAGTSYAKGVVAMAKAAHEPPGTAGSQFFVVTGDDVALPPDYAVIGTVADGLDVVERIGALGDAEERPTETVVVERIELERGP